MALVITPEANIPLPFDTTADEVKEFVRRAKNAMNTVKALEAAGAKIETTEKDKTKAREIFSGKETLILNHDTPGTILHLDTLLSEYDKGLVNSALRLRNFVTNRLLEESTNADPKIRIKALELLGKIGEVGLFAERVEIVHSTKSSKEVEQLIIGALEKYEKYMGNVEVISDEQVKVQDLDEELQTARVMEEAEKHRIAKPFVAKEFSIIDLTDEI